MKQTLFLLLLTMILMLLANYISKKSFYDKEKTSPFECGFDPLLITRVPFSLRFFKIAVIFLIFDIEIVLILPLPLINNTMNNLFTTSSLTIIFFILLGLFYEWNQGALNWMK